MKSALLLQLGATALLASAQPSLRRRHEHLHKKRDVHTAVATDFVNVSVYVYQDENGAVVSAETVTSAIPANTAAAVNNAAAPPSSPSVETTPSPAPAPTPTSQSSVQAAQASSPPQSSSAAPVVAPVQKAAGSSAASSPASQASSASGSLATGLNFANGKVGHGIAYSPYDTTPNGCRADIAGDISQLAAAYAIIRLYDVKSCDMVRTAIDAIKKGGSKTRLIVNLSQWTGEENPWTSELATLVNGQTVASDEWKYIHSVAVGNEWLTAGKCSDADLCSAIQKTKSAVQSAGFSGPVTAIEETGVYSTSPGFIADVDYCAVNIHPYFDPNTQAAQAGSTTQSQLQTVVNACGGKQVIITESGWPSGGGAKASPQDQQTAVTSINSAITDTNLVFFEAFNDNWKSGDACEHFFGVWPAIKNWF